MTIALKAARIFDLEHKIAAVHGSREDAEDVLKGNNHWARRDFATRAPGLDWDAFFRAAKLDGQNDFTVWQPSAVRTSRCSAVSTPSATACRPSSFVNPIMPFSSGDATPPKNPQLHPARVCLYLDVISSVHVD